MGINNYAQRPKLMKSLKSAEKPHFATHLRTIGLLSAMISASLAALPANAGSVSYNLTTDAARTVQQGSGSPHVTFNIESPRLSATGKPKMTPYDSLLCSDGTPGVEAQYIVKDMSYSYTDPATLEVVTVPFDFSDWVALNPLYECFSGPQTGNPVSAMVSVPADAAIGTYTAKMVAKGPNGIGWGEGAGVHMTFDVIEATATDTTPPDVTIIEPAPNGGNPQSFVLGDRIPLEFTATDAESAVSDWSAQLLPGAVDLSGLLTESPIVNGTEASGYLLSAVPGGTESIQVIGQYTFQVAATSEGGTSAPASRDFTVNYTMSPSAPHLTTPALVWDKSENSQGKCDKSQHGELQIKFTASAVQPADTEWVDNSLQAFVRDETVIVDIVADADNSLLLERTYGTDNGSSVAITGVTGDIDGGYFTKVDLCAAPAGDYTIYVFFADHSGNAFLQYSKPFTLQE